MKGCTSAPAAPAGPSGSPSASLTHSFSFPAPRGARAYDLCWKTGHGTLGGMGSAWGPPNTKGQRESSESVMREPGESIST